MDGLNQTRIPLEIDSTLSVPAAPTNRRTITLEEIQASGNFLIITSAGKLYTNPKLDAPAGPNG